MEKALKTSQCPENPLTPLTMFVCTYASKLSGLQIPLKEITEIVIAKGLHGRIKVMNSNWGHLAQPGYEEHIKDPIKIMAKRRKKMPPGAKQRKNQGDGTCFNSAIEFAVKIDRTDIPADKMYFVRCFPTSGAIQIPGSKFLDHTDVREALILFVDYLNSLQLSAAKIEIDESAPSMLDYKFSVIFANPRSLINMNNMATYFSLIERYKNIPMGLELREWGDIIPPFPVREVRFPIEEPKVSFLFKLENESPRLNIFQSGKINILGAKAYDTATHIYSHFTDLLEKNWDKLVCIKPQADSENVGVK